MLDLCISLGSPLFPDLLDVFIQDQQVETVSSLLKHGLKVAVSNFKIAFSSRAPASITDLLIENARFGEGDLNPSTILESAVVTSMRDADAQLRCNVVRQLLLCGADARAAIFAAMGSPNRLHFIPTLLMAAALRTTHADAAIAAAADNPAAANDTSTILGYAVALARQRDTIFAGDNAAASPLVCLTAPASVGREWAHFGGPRFTCDGHMAICALATLAAADIDAIVACIAASPLPAAHAAPLADMASASVGGGVAIASLVDAQCRGPLDESYRGGYAVVPHASSADAAAAAAPQPPRGTVVDGEWRGGGTLIHHATTAVRGGETPDVHVARLDTLVRLGGTIDAYDGAGLTAMHAAAAADDVASIETLAQYGASVDAPVLPVHPSCTQQMGLRALRYAVAGSTSGFRPREERAAIPDRWTPLTIAASRKRLKAVESLLALGADPQAAVPDGDNDASAAFCGDDVRALLSDI